LLDKDLGRFFAAKFDVTPLAATTYNTKIFSSFGTELFLGFLLDTLKMIW
jgi:hypothetical protein